MKKYNDLELSILCCVLLKPELMEKVILDDKYFIKHKKMWLFMKAVYKKFGSFDLTLITSVCKNQYRIIEYLLLILNQEPTACMFDMYQNQIIELYEEEKKGKYIREQIYELASELYVMNIDINEFKKQLDKIYFNADEIFKGE